MGLVDSGQLFSNHSLFWQSVSLAGIKTGVIDCSAKLPSGGDLKTKLKLDKDKGFPVLFMVANGQTAKQLNRNNLKSSDKIIGVALEFARLKYTRFDQFNAIAQKTFQSRCFKKKGVPCLVLLGTSKKGKKTKKLLSDKSSLALSEAQRVVISLQRDCTYIHTHI